MWERYRWKEHEPLVKHRFVKTSMTLMKYLFPWTSSPISTVSIWTWKSAPLDKIGFFTGRFDRTGRRDRQYSHDATNCSISLLMVGQKNFLVIPRSMTSRLPWFPDRIRWDLTDWEQYFSNEYLSTVSLTASGEGRWPRHVSSSFPRVSHLQIY